MKTVYFGKQSKEKLANKKDEIVPFCISSSLHLDSKEFYVTGMNVKYFVRSSLYLEKVPAKWHIVKMLMLVRNRVISPVYPWFRVLLRQEVKWCSSDPNLSVYGRQIFRTKSLCAHALHIDWKLVAVKLMWFMICLKTRLPVSMIHESTRNRHLYINDLWIVFFPCVVIHLS